MAGPEDIIAQLLSLSAELLDFSRRSPHLGDIERGRKFAVLQDEYFALRRASAGLMAPARTYVVPDPRGRRPEDFFG